MQGYICEVSPRDGLQSFRKILSVEQRFLFIQKLYDAGLHYIEVGSFVHPKAVPEMAGSTDLFQKVQHSFDDINHFSILIPNMYALDRALEIGVQNMAFFTASSQTFNQNNIRMSIEDSIIGIKKMISKIKEKNLLADLNLRLYISTVFHCPYEGKKDSVDSIQKFESLFNDFDEISLGDTTGYGTKEQVQNACEYIKLGSYQEKIWWHFHDTYNRASENVEIAIENGFYKFDSSAGGIGGCPYSPGATGNISTEKIIEIFDNKKIQHNYNLKKIQQATQIIN